MVSDSSIQAHQLFLAEALELCQQVKEGLLILAHAPTPLTYRKLVRRVQTLHQGVQSLDLMDIELLIDGLEALLETCVESVEPVAAVHGLLHHLCDALQLSLIAHRSIVDNTPAFSQRESVLYSLVPKVLEVFEVASTQTLPASLQSSLLVQQVKWIQFWSKSLNLTELSVIATAALTAFESFPQSALAIAQVALAGFRVAHEATIQRLISPDDSLVEPRSPIRSPISPQPFISPQRPPYPSEQAIEVFQTKQYLVGLGHQTIFCADTESIKEIALLEPSQLRYEDGHLQILWGEWWLLLHQFTDLWKPFRSVSQPSKDSKEPKDSLVLILTHDSQTFAIALNVDRIIVEAELKLERPDQTSHPCCYGIATLNQNLRVEVVDLNCLLREHSTNSLLAAQKADVPLAIQTLKSKPEASNLPQLVNDRETKTILIVDDSRTVREMLTLTLQGAGYSVLQAQDGYEAIEHLKHQAKIHLTICDIEMSNLNGFEFLRHRLQDPLWKNIPVFILSSHTDQAYRQLAQKLGAADYFTIPYKEKALIQAIKGLLNPK
jgi:CheY-like chemotaxis protein